MRLFVSGAAGFLGRALLTSARGSGVEVRGLVRRAEQAKGITALGATPVLGDLLEPREYASSLAGCDAIVHLAQSSSGDLEELRQVRVEGARRLIEAAVAQGVPRVVLGSGYWVYGDVPGTLVESSPLRPLHLSQLNYEAEEVARTAGSRRSIDPVIARPGMVYGPGSWLASWAKELQEGTFRYVGDGSNHMSPVHWKDCGEAFLRLSSHGVRGATYLVADDRPVTVRVFSEALASQLGVASPTGIPLERAQADWGPDLALLNAANRRASNSALRALGWTPSYPSYLEGLPEVCRELSGRSRGDPRAPRRVGTSRAGLSRKLRRT